MPQDAHLHELEILLRGLPVAAATLGAARMHIAKIRAHSKVIPFVGEVDWVIRLTESELILRGSNESMDAALTAIDNTLSFAAIDHGEETAMTLAFESGGAKH